MIDLERVSKRFGDTRALSDVSFSVPAGQITGFIGNNGAGKSTVMRAILGLLEVDAGSILVDGTPITAAYRAGIGYMPEEQALYPEMPVRRQLLFFARIQGLSSSEARRIVDELLELLGLTERTRDRVSELSLGNRQRVQLISTLVSSPHALMLDEPFSGMDPVAVDYMELTLRTCAARGVPILFSSHQLDLVERLCDRVVIIADGRIVASEDVSVLLRRKESSATVELSPMTPFSDDVLEGARILHVGEGATRLVLTSRSMPAVVRDLALRYDVVSVASARSTLTEIYRERIAQVEA